MKQSKVRTLRLDPDFDMRVEAAAAAENRTVADIFRAALEQYLLGRKLINDSDRRVRQMLEYSQAALHVIIDEQHPEFQERIKADLPRRLEQFHGAR